MVSRGWGDGGAAWRLAIAAPPAPRAGDGAGIVGAGKRLPVSGLPEFCRPDPGLPRADYARHPRRPRAPMRSDCGAFATAGAISGFDAPPPFLRLLQSRFLTDFAEAKPIGALRHRRRRRVKWNRGRESKRFHLTRRLRRWPRERATATTRTTLPKRNPGRARAGIFGGPVAWCDDRRSRHGDDEEAAKGKAWGRRRAAHDAGGRGAELFGVRGGRLGGRR